MKRDGVDRALELAVAAFRGVVGLALLRLAERVLPRDGADGAVAAEVNDDPTARIRPPLK